MGGIQIRKKPQVPDPVSSGTLQGGRCQPDQSLYAAERLIGSCARTRHSDVGSSLKEVRED